MLENYILTQNFNSKQMKVKRRFEVSIDTTRRFIIRQSAPGSEIACTECGESMLQVEQVAAFFNIRQRHIFQIVESGAAHFTETEAGAALICIPSLGRALEGEENFMPKDGDEKKR